MIIGTGPIPVQRAAQRTAPAPTPEAATDKSDIATPGGKSFHQIASAVLSDDNLQALTRWKFKLGGAIRSQPLRTRQGHLVVGNDEGKLAAVTKDGRKRWTANLEGAISHRPLVFEDGTLCVTTDKGHVYGIDPKTGRERWHHQLKVKQDASDQFRHLGAIKVTHSYHLQLVGTPMMGDDGNAYIGTANGIYTFDKRGRQESVQGSGKFGQNTEPVGSSGRGLVINQRGQGLARVERGRKRWNFETGGAHTSSATMDKSGTSYLVVNSSPEGLEHLPPFLQAKLRQMAPPAAGQLVAVGRDGKEKWRQELDGACRQQPTLHEGKLYVGTNKGVVSSFDASSGENLWDYHSRLPIQSSPEVGPDGTVFVSSGEDGLHALSINGQVRLHYSQPDWNAARPLLDEDGTLFVGGEDGHLYALEYQNLNNIKIEEGPEIEMEEDMITIGDIMLPVFPLE